MAALVWINGLPGTGKLTVTKTLGSLDESTIIVDNHSLIDPVAHRLGPGSRDHPRYLDERRASRKRAFDEWVHDPLSKTLRVVFTDFQSDNELGRSVAHEYEAAAREAGRPFIPVYLSCDAQTNLQRATSHERKLGATTKLTDLIVLERIISTARLYQFDGHHGFALDTTGMSPEEAAYMILAYCREAEALDRH